MTALEDDGRSSHRTHRGHSLDCTGPLRQQSTHNLRRHHPHTHTALQSQHQSQERRTMLEGARADIGRRDAERASNGGKASGKGSCTEGECASCPTLGTSWQHSRRRAGRPPKNRYHRNRGRRVSTATRKSRGGGEGDNSPHWTGRGKNVQGGGELEPQSAGRREVAEREGSPNTGESPHRSLEPERRGSGKEKRRKTNQRSPS